MKIFRKIAILCLAACLGFTAVGCKKGPTLAKPQNLVVDTSALTLTWDKVENATNYLVSVNGKNSIVAKTTFSLVNLDAGEYTLKVKARDAKGGYDDSEWSSGVGFTKDKENGLQYALTNANTEYTVTGIGTAGGDLVIGDTYRGKPVTSIAAKAFYGKNVLKSVTIGKNIKSIGASAFTNCSQMTSVTFSDGVTEIGEYAFQGCRNLTSVTLPENLESVAKYAFRYCRNLSAINFNDGLVSIGDSAFAECDKLVNITLPDSVTTIGEGAFQGCDALSGAVIGNGVTTIGAKAFSEDKNLVGVTFGSSLLTIGESAFYACAAIESVTVPDSVTAIGDSAFYGCEALSSVSLGEGLKSIGRYAFQKTGVYTAENKIYYVDDWVVDSEDDIVTPEIKDGIVGIADYAFYKRESLTGFTLPASVKIVGARAFSNCPVLTGFNLGSVEEIGDYSFSSCKTLGRAKVNLGDKLKKIGNYAFYNCSGYGDTAYAKVTIPSSVETIGTYAFRGAWDYAQVKKAGGGVVYVDKWLVDYAAKAEGAIDIVIVKDGIVGISNYAFYNNASVQNIYLPASLQTIGMAAFYGCSELASVNFDDFCMIPEIPDYAFYKCALLKSVKLPRKVAKIGRSAFYKSGLTNIEIVRNVTEIDAYAFYGCSDLLLLDFVSESKLEKIGDYAFGGGNVIEKVTLPDGLTGLGRRAFYKSASLQSVKFGSSLKEIGEGAFESCTSLTTVDLGETIETVGKRAFYKCAALGDVNFGNVRSIGDYAFYGCAGLTTLKLPETLDTIGDYAFRNCGLTEIVLRSGIKSVGAHAFNGNKNITFFVEDASVMSGWSARWNSAYRPVITGCVMSEDGTYVVSFVKTEDTLINVTDKTPAGDPVRDGYTFGGWKVFDEETQTEIVYKTADIAGIADGTTLTAVWNEVPSATDAE